MTTLSPPVISLAALPALPMVANSPTVSPVTPVKSPGADTLLRVTPYSAESCLITGEGTFSVKEQIKAAGGRWNDRLKGAHSKGWIFPIRQLGQCEQLVAKLLAEGQVQVGTPKRATPARGAVVAGGVGMGSALPANVIESSVKTTRGETDGVTWERTERTEIVLENGQKVETVTTTQTQRRVLV